MGVSCGHKNGDSLGEPIIFVEPKTSSYLHASFIDKFFYENHKSKLVGTTTYQYFLN